jgi:hypothetical protein
VGNQVSVEGMWRRRIYIYIYQILTCFHIFFLYPWFGLVCLCDLVSQWFGLVCLCDLVSEFCVWSESVSFMSVC